MSGRCQHEQSSLIVADQQQAAAFIVGFKHNQRGDTRLADKADVHVDGLDF